MLLLLPLVSRSLVLFAAAAAVEAAGVALLLPVAAWAGAAADAAAVAVAVFVLLIWDTVVVVLHVVMTSARETQEQLKKTVKSSECGKDN